MVPRCLSSKLICHHMDCVTKHLFHWLNCMSHVGHGFHGIILFAVGQNTGIPNCILIPFPIEMFSWACFSGRYILYWAITMCSWFSFWNSTWRQFLSPCIVDGVVRPLFASSSKLSSVGVPSNSSRVYASLSCCDFSCCQTLHPESHYLYCLSVHRASRLALPLVNIFCII